MISPKLKDWLEMGAVVIFGQVSTFYPEKSLNECIEVTVGPIWGVLQRSNLELAKDLVDDDREEVENIVREAIVKDLNKEYEN